MPLLTLTTDIGQNDYITGAVKGQLLKADDSFNIVDISHQLSPFNFQQTAYICSSAFRHFPEGTFHLVIVNLFDSPPGHLLIAEHNAHFIGCPDNGILTMITGTKPKSIVAIPVESSGGTHTLQCTQAWAKAFVTISKSKKLQSVGTSLTEITEKYPLRCTIGPDWMEGQIIFIDNFENVVVNITESEFEEHRKGRTFKIVFTRNETISSLSESYATVSPGEKMAWFNAAGYLELAINKGNMAGLFGLRGITEGTRQNSTSLQNEWFYKTVRIFFE